MKKRLLIGLTVTAACAVVVGTVHLNNTSLIDADGAGYYELIISNATCPLTKDMYVGDTFTATSFDGNDFEFVIGDSLEGDLEPSVSMSDKEKDIWGVMKSGAGAISLVSRIGGIKKLVIETETEGATFFTEWGWYDNGELVVPEDAYDYDTEADAFGSYSFNFNNEYPSYIAFNSNFFDTVTVYSIHIFYTCSTEDNIPDTYID